MGKPSGGKKSGQSKGGNLDSAQLGAYTAGATQGAHTKRNPKISFKDAIREGAKAMKAQQKKRQQREQAAASSSAAVIFSDPRSQRPLPQSPREVTSAARHPQSAKPKVKISFKDAIREGATKMAEQQKARRIKDTRNVATPPADLRLTIHDPEFTTNAPQDKKGRWEALKRKWNKSTNVEKLGFVLLGAGGLALGIGGLFELTSQSNTNKGVTSSPTTDNGIATISPTNAWTEPPATDAPTDESLAPTTPTFVLTNFPTPDPSPKPTPSTHHPTVPTPKPTPSTHHPTVPTPKPTVPTPHPTVSTPKPTAPTTHSPTSHSPTTHQPTTHQPTTHYPTVPPTAPIELWPLVQQAAFPDQTSRMMFIRDNAGTSKYFKIPSNNDPTFGKIKNMVRAIIAYDRNPTQANSNNLENILSDCGYVYKRMPYADPDNPQPSEENVLLFSPKSDIVGGTYHFSLAWRFGALREPGNQETAKNPARPIGVISPHQGYDGADLTAIRKFDLGAKFLLMNYAKRYALPKGTSTFQEGSSASDADHANTGLIPALQAACEEEPNLVAEIVHGEDESHDQEWWGENGYGGQFLFGSKRDYATLQAIAYAHFDFGATMALGSNLPYFVVDGRGNRRPLTDQNGDNPFYVRLKPFATNTSVMSRVMHGTNGDNLGQNLGNVVHNEHANAFTHNGSQLEIMMQATDLAMYFLENWDERVHNTDPARLPIGIVQNIRLFKGWFDEKLKLAANLPPKAKRTL